MYYEKLSDLGIKLNKRSGQEKTFCPMCHDGRKHKNDRSLSVNITNGDFSCKNCGWQGNVRTFYRKQPPKVYEKPPQDVIKTSQMMEKARKWLNSRGISDQTTDHFMIFSKMEFMPQTGKEESCICFPYIRNSEIINIKYRDAKKNFKMFKNAEQIVFNLQGLGEKRYVIITEGEIDCMSAYEAGYGHEDHTDLLVDDETGDTKVQANDRSKWVPVSVPNGAPPPQNGENNKIDMAYLENCADWFVDVYEFIIATDDDPAGRRLKDELVRRLGIEKCRTIKYPALPVVETETGINRPCKDLNEVLMYIGPDAVRYVLDNAEKIPVEGITYVSDIFPIMLENFKKGIPLAPTTRFGVEADIYTRWKKRDVDGYVGYANAGKTFYFMQRALTKSMYDGWKWGVFSPENYPANDFFDDLVEMYTGKWLKQMTEEEYIEASLFINEHIFYVYPEDSHDLISIHDRFRYLVLSKGIDGVLLDPWNQLDHNQKSYQREDQYISEQIKTIKRFAQLNDISYNIILHPKNPDYPGTDKDGNPKPLPVVDIYFIAGGAMFANKLDNIYSYYRPKFHENKKDPTVEVYSQKIRRKRTGGELGKFMLTLNWSTKRYINDEGYAPCDPKRAAAVVANEKSDYKQGLLSDQVFGGDDADSLPF